MTYIEIDKSPICFLHAHHLVHVLYMYLETPRDVYWGSGLVKYPGPQWSSSCGIPSCIASMMLVYVTSCYQPHSIVQFWNTTTASYDPECMVYIYCFSPTIFTESVIFSSNHNTTGFEFPVEFIPTVRKIFQTYFLAHMYYHHFQEILRLALHDGLNTLFLHFMYFVQEFSLLEPKEYSCMEEFITKLMQLDQDWAKRPLSDEYSGSLATNADDRHS